MVQSQPEDKNLFVSPDQLLSSLVNELKSPLILIARQAESEKSSAHKTEFESIQKAAEKSLQLIDSYLLMAQSEYGQRALRLEPVGVGSVIYEVAKELAPYAKSREVDFTVDVKDSHVMANRQGLKAVIMCLSELFIEQNSDEKYKKRKVRIETRREHKNVAVSVLSSELEITNKDLELARRMQGNSHLANGKMPDSGIRLAIAEVLTNSLGSHLQVRQINGLRGLNFELAGSKQLQLI